MKNKILQGLSCYQLMYRASGGCFLVFLGFLLILLGAGCSNLELPKAFDGEFSAVKNNKLIYTYCTSCHNHKEFNSEQHVLKVRQKYKRKIFRRTSECRTCHYLEKVWDKDHSFRKTRRPKQVNRGDFRKFEKNY
ncbi:MAG TPA: hypothetical protein EYQ84_05765 [Nitrospinaceae bacterium]|nr:hypothetical protein [Nitrospinaceae bacterium]HIL27513.1 hypothetical protein [Nitrospinaceae bacterium]